jgi:dienelactone hydrolase
MKTWIFLALALGISPPLAWAATVHQLCDAHSPSRVPFPNDLFTVLDYSQLTHMRINLPKPDCSAQRSECEDVDVLNMLDGFSLQPRLTIPFDGPIDLRSVTGDSVYLVRLGSAMGGRVREPQRRIGINRIEWDIETATLVAEPDEILEQDTRYAIVVTAGVRALDGSPVGVVPGCPHTFTTETATALLEKIRRQIKSSFPNPASFTLVPSGSRTVFPVDQVQGITFSQQTSIVPQFSVAPISLTFLNLVPGAIGQIAFGKCLAPDYMAHPGEFIPAVSTLTGRPQTQRTADLYFNLYLPAGQKPTLGWPAMIFHHGANGTKDGARNIAASLSARGIATIAINHVGHGGGPLSTLTVVTKSGASVTFPAGGRGFDQNGDGLIPVREGDTATAPRSLLGFSDGIRQTVIDTMQLVRVIQIGMDVDGDGRSDLDPRRIYDAGNSLGGAVSTIVMAVEPDIRAGVIINPAGGPDPENARLSPVNRTGNLATALASRTPSLINTPGITSVGGIPIAAPFFNENRPLRNQSPVINSVPGAMAIQTALDRMQWAREAGTVYGYVRHLRKEPLDRVPMKSVLFQFSRGDQQSVDVNNVALLTNGDLLDRTTYYRHDIAYAENPTLPKNSHGFPVGFSGGNFDVPAIAAIALAAQGQTAIFFESDGTNISQPQPVRYFESPIRQPLPDGLNYIP